MIDSFLTDDQRMIRDAARDFATEVLAPHAGQWDRDVALPDEVVRQLGKLGLLSMIVPAEWGGTFSDYVGYALAIKEIAVGCASCSTLMAVHNSVGCGPIPFGTEAQKAEYLPKLATGEMIGAFCLTESQAGSEANNLKTPAPLNGTASGCCPVRSSSRPTARARAWRSCSLSPTPSWGRRVCPRSSCPRIHRVSTLGSPSTRWVFVLPILARFHSRTARFLQTTCWARGEGLKIALANLEGGRIGIVAQAVDIARAAFDAARAYSHERMQFGKPIKEHQSVANLLADMQTSLNAARLLVLHAARMRTEGLPCLSEASQAKLFASEMAERVCSQTIQIHGGYGYLEDYPVERHYRDARITQIYEGTNEVQRMVRAATLGRLKAALVSC